MALMVQISTENETYNYKSNSHEGKINHVKPKDSRSFPTLSPTTGNALCSVLSLSSLHTWVSCACAGCLHLCVSMCGGCRAALVVVSQAPSNLHFVSTGALYWLGTQCLC